MKTTTLHYPIYTLDNKVLIPAGVTITDEVIKDVIASNKNSSARNYSLMKFGSVHKDVVNFISNPPYQLIFDDKEDTDEVLEVMKQISLPAPVLESLDYFRQNDFHTYRHMLMIFALSTLLAKMLVPDYQNRIKNASASPSHDLGKICVPLEVLLKREPLTKEERQVLFQHPISGYVLLCYHTKQMDSFSARVARDHHERRDGSGYARGIKQNDLMVEIVAACDVYDALISPRPYRPVSFDNRTALEELTSMAQRKQIGWETLQALVALNRKDKPNFRSFTVSLEKRGTQPPNNSYGKTAVNGSPAANISPA